LTIVGAVNAPHAGGRPGSPSRGVAASTADPVAGSPVLVQAMSSSAVALLSQCAPQVHALTQHRKSHATGDLRQDSRAGKCQRTSHGIESRRDLG
jgi:hypothetical protein